MGPICGEYFDIQIIYAKFRGKMVVIYDGGMIASLLGTERNLLHILFPFESWA